MRDAPVAWLNSRRRAWVSVSTRMVVVPMPIVYIMHAQWSTHPADCPRSRPISSISPTVHQTGRDYPTISPLEERETRRCQLEGPEHQIRYKNSALIAPTRPIRVRAESARSPKTNKSPQLHHSRSPVFTGDVVVFGVKPGDGWAVLGPYLGVVNAGVDGKPEHC